MGKKKKSEGTAAVPTSDAGALKANPFGALAGLSAPSPTPSGENDGDEPSPRAGDGDASRPQTPTRAILSYERKGRGGKEVTLVELRGVVDEDLAQWLSLIKKALGCGGFVEGSRLAVTGDQRQRLQSLFSSLGVDRVTVG